MKISIVTPSYNQADYIEQTIQSVVSQEGDFELEYLVMDGGSTDDTIEILKKYEDKLIWYSEKDEGQSDAVNKGLKRVTGEIIGWINSDDLYEPGAFRRVLDLFSRKPAAKWVYGKCRIIDENNREIRRLITLYKNILLCRYSYNRLLTANYISQMTVFFRRELVNTVGYLDVNNHTAMDYDYWLRIGKLYPPRFINEYLADFRWYTQSKSGADYRQQLIDAFNTAKRHASGKRWPIWLHKLNSWKITLSYDIMRLVRSARQMGM